MSDTLLQTLVDLGLTDDWHHMVDSNCGSCPFTVHRHKREAHSKTLGRSRCSFMNNIDMRCDNQRRPSGFALIEEQVSEENKLAASQRPQSHYTHVQ